MFGEEDADLLPVRRWAFCAVLSVSYCAPTQSSMQRAASNLSTRGVVVLVSIVFFFSCEVPMGLVRVLSFVF